MRALVRPGPEVDVAQAEVIAIEGEGTGFRPGPNDQVVRLVKALMREIGLVPDEWYSEPMPRTKPAMMRPFDRLSSIANSSAM